MASGFQCNMVGLTDPTAIPAVAVVSPNTRVMTGLGPLATLADVVQFAPPWVSGFWLVPAMRCQVGGVPAITATSGSIALLLVLGVPTPTAPMRINSPDPRAQGS